MADTGHRLDIFTSTAVLMINRLSGIPGTIELNPDVVALVGNRGGPATVEAVNQFLHRLSARLGSDAIFVVNERGEVVGSSNTTQQDDSKLGEDISYRPYFQDALSGFVGRHFSLGEAPDIPGYFVAHPIHDGDRIVGIATVKISLQPVVEAFSLLGKPALIADRDNVVVLSSERGWLYASLKPLTVAQRVDLELTGMYGHHRIGAFPAIVDLDVDKASLGLDEIVKTGLSDLLVQGRVLDGMDWKLLVFSDLADVRRQGVVAGALASALAAFVFTLALYLAQRRRAARQRQEAKDALERINARLEMTIARRTRALTETNAELRQEMDERIRTEQALRATQDDLVQAAKLTAFGELATGITHELAQPLGAIQTLAGNTREFIRRGDLENAQGNLAVIGEVVDTMAGIIHPLRSFAKKSPAEPEMAEVARAVQSALLLLDGRLRSARIEVVNDCDHPSPVVWCNRNRLEQVLVNLIANACDAMEDGNRRILHIRTDEGNGHVVISVADTGKGFDPGEVENLFIPFRTTKSTGLGLGLAISRSIAREYGGDLTAKSGTEGGAVFRLKLPAVPSGSLA
ncbi:MAG: ATP-binding protein [Paracoccus sp. (in: a-proteobacteria)]|uniref:ATP-binding protein n=1 Tax=Paracoccus sp. TaxID=267 RepID=UPI0039E2E8F6